MIMKGIEIFRDTKNVMLGAGEIDHQVKPLAALAEDWNYLLSAHIAAHNI